MPRPPSISYHDFKKVAVSLTSEGKSLTFQLLRERLGGISHDVLRRYINQFDHEREISTQHRMPDLVLSGAQALYEQAKQDARKEVLEEYEQLLQAVESERSLLRQERVTSGNEVAEATGRATSLQKQVDYLLKQNESLLNWQSRLDEANQTAAQWKAKAESLQLELKDHMSLLKQIKHVHTTLSEVKSLVLDGRGEKSPKTKPKNITK